MLLYIHGEKYLSITCKNDIFIYDFIYINRSSNLKQTECILVDTEVTARYFLERIQYQNKF